MPRCRTCRRPWQQGRVTSSDLTRAYLARIEAYDRQGPALNSVRVTNPDALSIAAGFDAVKPSARQPLAGLPILVKDNIATGDKQPTTAGSLALEGAHAKDDATVVKKLRAAGAVILGKANLTEFANILAVGMPSGYSSIAGYVRNPYAPRLMDRSVRRSCSPAVRAPAPPSPSRPASAPPRSAPKRRARCSAPPPRTASSP